MTKIIKIGWRKYIIIIDTDNLEFITHIKKLMKKNFPKFKFVIITKTF